MVIGALPVTLESISTSFATRNITLPDTPWQVSGGRQGLHTEHMGHLLSELQYMQRAYPGLQW